jgi:peptidoglycan hydrolase-like protein with peptidoglycan-binding domain
MKNFNKKLIIIIFAIFSVFGLMGQNTLFAAGPATVNLGSAGNFVILAKTGISTTGTTSVVGDIGVSPAAATSITGFGLILPAAGAYSTSALVAGKVYAPGYAVPTPVNLTNAVSDMQTAYTNASGRINPTATELGAGNLGGMTLAPGLYKWSTSVTIPTDVTLSGNANDVWIFQIAQNLNISSAKKVILSGGAKSRNVFWVVAGKTTIGTTAIFNGNILDQTTIVLNTGATLNGRALTQAAVTLDSNSVIIPSGGGTESASSESNNSSGNNGSSVTLPAASIFGQTISTIAGSLKKGSMGEFVKSLQKFLISQNTKNQALKNYGPDGKFGSTTKAALIEWQLAHGLTGDGVFGLKTKAKIKELAL